MRTKAKIRIRHYRGRGVHSPFAYGIVRNVRMDAKPLPDVSPLYSYLHETGMADKTASFIQRLFTYMECSECEIDGKILDGIVADTEGPGMTILTPAMDECISTEMQIAAHSDKRIVVLTEPRKTLRRNKMCCAIVSGHRGLSIDCCGTIVVFNTSGLNDQHIKL